MHIHVLMLFFNFELIPIIIEIFTNFLSCSKIKPKSQYYIVHDLWPNFMKNGNGRIPFFIIFPDAYTCPYVVFQF